MSQKNLWEGNLDIFEVEKLNKKIPGHYIAKYILREIRMQRLGKHDRFHPVCIFMC